jgi:hypothetical protein
VTGIPTLKKNAVIMCICIGYIICSQLNEKLGAAQFIFPFCNHIPAEVIWNVIRPPLLQWKNCLTREVASLVGDNLLVFYYPSASEIWSDKRSDILWEGGYCIYKAVKVLFLCVSCVHLHPCPFLLIWLKDMHWTYKIYEDVWRFYPELTLMSYKYMYLYLGCIQ